MREGLREFLGTGVRALQEILTWLLQPPGSVAEAIAGGARVLHSSPRLGRTRNTRSSDSQAREQGSRTAISRAIIIIVGYFCYIGYTLHVILRSHSVTQFTDALSGFWQMAPRPVELFNAVRSLDSL